MPPQPNRAEEAPYLSGKQPKMGAVGPLKIIRVLLVDDHGIVREGLRKLIQARPDLTVVAEAANGNEAVEQTAACKPDVVVMDLSMPLLNGSRATEIIKASHPATKVLVLTMHDDVACLRQLIKAGADGYVLKDSASTQIIRAIRIVGNGGVYFDEKLAGKALTTPNKTKGATEAGLSRDLSQQETKVLTLLAWGYSSKEIGGKLALSAKTVETYKERIKEKLGFHGRAEMVQYALHRGLLHESSSLLGRFGE